MDTLKKNEIDFNDPILKEVTLLILDEDQSFLDEIAFLFKGYFKELITANNAHNASEIYAKRKNDIDIILSSLSSGNTHLDFIKFIRTHENNLPILVIAEDHSVDNLIQAIRLKVTDYLLKPLKLSDVLHLIYTTINHKKSDLILKKKQRELEEFKNVFEKEFFLIEFNLNREIIYVNDLICQVSGYEKEDLLGEPNEKLRHAEYKESRKDEIFNTISSGKTWRGKIKNIAKDGSVFIVNYSIFPIFNTNNEIEKFIATGVLITNEEEEKNSLKKYIIKQKSDVALKEKVHQTNMEKEIDKAIKQTKLDSKKEYEDILFIVKELQSEIEKLRLKNEQYSSVAKQYEDELLKTKENNKKIKDKYNEKYDLFKNQLERIFDLKQEYEYMKEQNQNLQDTLHSANLKINHQQESIEDYRKRITRQEEIILELKSK